MSFQVLACLSVFALAILAYGATPETGRVLDTSSSMSRLHQFKELPNLRIKVDANCRDIPLREFLSKIAKQTDTLIYLDERKFANTEVAFSQPLTISVDEQISLESALNLALEPLHLEHYIKNGRVVVTNESFIVQHYRGQE